MSIPVSIDPLGTLGVTLFDTLRLPVGTTMGPIVYETPFTGPVTGRADIELLTYNTSASTDGGIEFKVGGWGVEGSCLLVFRHYESPSDRIFYMPLAYRSYSISDYRFPRPASGTMHTVVTLSQDGMTGRTNDTVIRYTGFSAINGTGKNFRIVGKNLINAFDIHSVDFSDASKTLSFRPATKNGVNGLYELYAKNFHPIPGSIAL